MNLDHLIASYRDYYGTYHHHKEQMAYGATVLYLGATTAVAFQGSAIWQYRTPDWLTTLLLVGSAVVTFLFVWWQMRQREFAADLVAACTALYARSVASTLSSPDLSAKKYRSHEFPTVLVKELEDIADDRGRTAAAARSCSIRK